MTTLEEAALSGALFEPRSNSPTRSDSTSSPLNTDDELSLSDHEGVLEGVGSTTALVSPTTGARTGIKGVMNDNKAYAAHRRAEGQREAREVRERMERAAITIPVPSADTDAHADDGVSGWREKRRMELELNKKGLKEVGKEGFVGAVEKAGWVLVLIYEPEISRCQDLLRSMLELSSALSGQSTHLDTPVTLLRARATTLAFSLLPRPERLDDDHDHDEEGDEEDEEREADADVLPTILAYKDGELERNWIRVDWEIDASGQGSLEELLRSECILPKDGFDDRIPQP